MNFHELSLPQSKKYSASCTLREFPIDRIPEKSDDKPFTGIFNGLSVEVIDPDAIKQLYLNGCYGLSSKTKNVPKLLHKFPQVQNVNQSQYEQKLAWNAKFTNQNPNLVMVNLLLPTEEETTLIPEGSEIHTEIENIEDTEVNDDESNKIDETQNEDDGIVDDNQPMEIVDVAKNQTEPVISTENKEPVLNLVPDPFPIEDTLALFPEEAFFLHFSLRCLKILNFDQTHEYTTEEALEKFCNMNPKFIERFVVYHFYRSKNWVVRSGLKFGGDFRKSFYINFKVDNFFFE